MTWPVQHISQPIDAPIERVIAIAGDPEQLPRWATGLSAGIRNENGRWVTESPMGIVEVRYVGALEHGVLDHDVTLPDGTVVHNPLRVLPNDGGSEVVFSLFQPTGTNAEEFEADARLVREDLARLKELVDGS